MEFEEAKQKIAEKNGFDNWWFLSRKCDDTRLDKFHKEVAELMCNEAVREFKNKVINLKEPFDKEDPFSGEVIWPDDIIELLSLPFPENQYPH